MSVLSELDQLSRASRIFTPGIGTGSEMTHTIIAAVNAGDNVLIPPPGLRIAIYELLLMNNTGTQTIVLKDGTTPLFQVSNWQLSAALFFGYAGNGEPHFIVSAGNALVINLSTGSLVEGFAKYKVIG